MTTTELAANILTGNLEMLKGHIADFTEQEMLVRPVPGANHTTWQLGHLIAAEARMTGELNPASLAALPAGFAEKFNKKTAQVDDPKAFPGKAEILDTYSKLRAATVAWAKTLMPADLDKPGPESVRAFAPTVGHLLAMIPIHTTMHIGQIQVIRRKLGRPVMF